MDANIKNKITKLYGEGYGYKKIALTLNISVGSVRNALSTRDEGENCKFCGKRLVFVTGKKKKSFCSDSCRYGYWNERRRAK